MTMTPSDVEGLFQGQISSGFAAPGEDGEIANEEKLWRVLQLRGVLAAAQQAWESGSQDLDLIAEKVGDGSRDATWRIPLGESGVLQFFMDLISKQGLRPMLQIHTLRVIGNSSADTDENRKRVVESGLLSGALLNLVRDDTLIPFVIPVIYNICVDYEPAQLEASKAGLSRLLIHLISSTELSKYVNFLTLICKILGLLVTQEPEPGLAHPSTPSLRLSLTTQPANPLDLEDFTNVTSVALAYISHEQLQPGLLAAGGFEIMQQVFYNSYTQFDLSTADADEAAQLKQVWNAFVMAFADISALPEFSTMYPLGSSAVSRLVAWLASPASFTHLQTAACLSLGNLARSDEVSTALVRDVYPLVAIILSNNSSVPPTPSPGPAKTVSSPSQLLHAALSFLKNLAIAPANKPLIGGLLDQPQSILPRLWSSSDAQSQTQFAAVSLTRLLLTGCPENVRRVCAPLSADPHSPAHERSNVHVLTGLFNRVDAEPTKLEAARALAAICRVLHLHPVLPILPDEWTASDMEVLLYSPIGQDAASGDISKNPSGLAIGLFDNVPVPVTVPVCHPDASEDEKRRSHFYAVHIDMAVALSVLLTQKKFPVLRSEALFVFALMSRSHDGARVVLRVLQLVEASIALVEAVTGQGIMEMDDAAAGRGQTVDTSSEMQLVDGLGLQPQQADPQQRAGMAKIDRENGLVLVAEMLRNFSANLPPLRRSGYEELLAKGSELVIQERQQGQGAS